MNIANHSAIIGALFAFALSSPSTGMQIYPNQQDAIDTCRPNDVVFIDIDRGRYYFPAQPEYGQAANGGFGCFSLARREYASGGFLPRETPAPTRQAANPSHNGSSGSSAPPTTTTSPGR